MLPSCNSDLSEHDSKSIKQIVVSQLTDPEGDKQDVIGHVATCSIVLTATNIDEILSRWVYAIQTVGFNTLDSDIKMVLENLITESQGKPVTFEL